MHFEELGREQEKYKGINLRGSLAEDLGHNLLMGRGPQRQLHCCTFNCCGEMLTVVVWKQQYFLV